MFVDGAILTMVLEPAVAADDLPLEVLGAGWFHVSGRARFFAAGPPSEDEGEGLLRPAELSLRELLDVFALLRAEVARTPFEDPAPLSSAS